MTTLPDLSGLPPVPQQRGGAPGLLADELLHTIRQQIRSHPRSQQAAVGPSEVGTDCTRRLAYKLAGVPQVNAHDDAWKPTVGTAVHTWLADSFTEANAGQAAARWLVELRVDVGEAGGRAVVGSVDLYDRVTATCIDWKVVGAASLKAKKAAGHPGRQYATQLHLYARGLVRRGLPVDTVMLVALPQNADLNASWTWHQPYDEQVAVDALARLDTVAGLVATGGAAAAAVLPTADAWCSFCPWFAPAATDLTSGCPGHAGRQQRRESFAGLIPPVASPLKETA